jgi:hypothetical protein
MGAKQSGAGGAPAQVVSDSNLSSLLSECQPLLEVIAGTLVTDDIQLAAGRLRDPEFSVDGAAAAAKTALSGALTGILSKPLECGLRETVASPLGENSALVKSLIDEVHALRESLNRDDLISFLQPHAQFRTRIQQDAGQKEAIATYVARQYFRDSSFRCFIQGSSLAIYLGQQIALSGVDGILIHTNSVPFPLTVLNQHSGKSVYSFCGEIYDPYCAAWLFPRRDIKTAASLRELFARSEKPLTTCFIMPLFVTTDGKMYFQSDETRFLVEILAREAPKCVILAVSERIRSGDVGGSPIGLTTMDMPSASDGREVDVICCGPFSDGLSAEAVRESLRRPGRTVHTKDGSVDWIVS